MGKANQGNHKKPTVTASQKEEQLAETHFSKLVSECARIAKLNPPYIWGGGHGGFQYNPSSLDCSGAVSLALHLAGYDVTPMDSGTLMTWGDAGPGKVTIWANSSHVFLQFANKCWAWSCAGCDNGWQSFDNYGEPPNGYVARHPPDLGGPAGEIDTTGSASEGSVASADVASTSKAAAISSFLELPGILESAESEALKGTRSLMNDQPLMPFVEQLVQASLRDFMSMPDGRFYAFIPDYFGGLTKRQAYWEIQDTEIIDGTIYLSDDALATHVYVAGDTNADHQVNFIDQIQSIGIVTVINGFQADFITGVNAPSVTRSGETKPTKAEENKYNTELAKINSLAEKQNALAFLQKYGARPYYEEAPMIRSHYFEMFLAYQKFCLLWAQQFEAQFEFTFMPELFPGGIVKFPDYGIQMYIQEVSHSGNYENGFVTRATLIAPSALRHNGRKGVESGMVRAGIFDL